MSKRITNKLREDLAKFSKGFPNATYLEIGFGDGYTMASLSNFFRALYGVDTDPENLIEARKLFAENSVNNATVFCGDRKRIPMNRYDVISVASNGNVLEDTIDILTKNIGDKPFIIVYSNYGSNDSVKSFCDKNFSSFMVPVGDTEAKEAVACAFNSDMKKKHLSELRAQKQDFLNKGVVS